MGIDALFEFDRKISHIRNILALLEWDMETEMPSQGLEERGEESALLSSLYHKELCSPALAELVSSIDETTLSSDVDKALVRWYKKEIARETRLPSSLVERKSRVTSRAHASWFEAKRNNDFSFFKNDLKEIIDILREEAELIDSEKSRYDVLLDDYESGITTQDIDPLFNSLEAEIHRIMDKTEERSSSFDDGFLRKGYDPSTLEGFCRHVMEKMGFDFSRGTVARSAHPFTTTIGPDDVRVTNRFTDKGLFDPLGSIIHETGHALYEMHSSLNPQIRGTSLSGGTSMGFHESQSRFWENFIGRSRAFWVYYYDDLRKIAPSLKGIALDDFIKGINKSTPSAIRVNADELTYSLHIIMRYRLEKDLIEGDLSVDDLPQAWNEASLNTIRYKVKNDSEGCLQDNHWAGGLFGYFPTYALGNIYAASLYKTLLSHIGGEEVLSASLEKGEYSAIVNFLDRNIWYKGGIYPPKDILLEITGKPLEMDSYVEYLENKFISLFG